ncbi:MAG: 1-(5-phosphoribosyl)-5-[(5-phosphoribosylamino)methylideneamino]imidazole-4-carboxamide isomerase [Candidatus Micrarchaeota archaeon]
MMVIPAVDILGKKCVRLRKGDFGSASVFSREPEKIAREFVEDGAEILHVVDLDGARTGRMKNFGVIERIIRNSDARVQVGGGIRDAGIARKIIRLGANVVIGTAALGREEFVREIVNEFGGARVVVALDAMEGKVAVEGWARKTRMDVFEAAKKFERIGVGGILFTSVERDGMLVGPDVRSVEKMARAVDVPVIASGGISSLGDLKALARAGAWGAIVGRALYEKKFELKEAVSCLRKG